MRDYSGARERVPPGVSRDKSARPQEVFFRLPAHLPDRFCSRWLRC